MAHNYNEKGWSLFSAQSGSFTGPEDIWNDPEAVAAMKSLWNAGSLKTHGDLPAIEDSKLTPQKIMPNGGRHMMNPLDHPYEIAYQKQQLQSESVPISPHRPKDDEEEGQKVSLSCIKLVEEFQRKYYSDIGISDTKLYARRQPRKNKHFVNFGQ